MKILTLLLIFGCSGCALFTPYAQWPNGSPVYPGAYKIATENMKNPNYHPTTLDVIQRKLACSGPEPSGICNNS